MSSSVRMEIAFNAFLSFSNVGAGIVVCVDKSLSDCEEGG